MRVLVADDSLVSARVVRGMLESLGCSVSHAANGRDAVEACLRETFDAVLMDVRMPELDGIDAARQIRRREPAERRTPIIALTANELAAETARCLESGMDACLIKPVGVTQLRETLLRVTGVATSAGDSAPTTEAGEPAESIDERVLDELRAYLGPRAVAERIDDYLDHLEMRLRSLRAAWTDDDGGELARLVHGLKGTSGFVGAHRLAGLCRTAEQAAQDGGLADGALIAALEREGGAVARCLREWRQTVDGAGRA